MKTSYSLRGGTVEKLSKDIRATAEALPDLEQVSLGLITTIDGDEEEEEKPKKARKGSKSSKKAKKAAPEPDDEDEGVADPFENEAALDAEDDDDDI